MRSPLKRLWQRRSGRAEFRDGRSGRLILIPHCALNQNARVAGAAESPAGMVELVTALLARDVGIFQMPCPELCAFGLDRGHVRFEKELRTPTGQAFCRELARDVVKQIDAYRACGLRVLGVLGKNGSPTCGVEETWDGGFCKGTGAFVEALVAELQDCQIVLPIAGIRDGEPDAAIAIVDQWLADGDRRR